MSIPTVKFSSKVKAKRVTSSFNRETKTRIIAYINERAVRCYHPTTDKDLFREVTGLNSEGDEPSGFDRKIEHTFEILLGEASGGTANVVGINCLHARHYSRNFVPAKLEKVTTVRIDFLAGGAIWDVTLRPYRMSIADLGSTVSKLRELAAQNGKKGRPIVKGDTVEGVGRIEELNESFMVFTPKRKKQVVIREEEQGLDDD